VKGCLLIVVQVISIIDDDASIRTGLNNLVRSLGSLKKGAGGKNATGPSHLHLMRCNPGKLLRTIHHGRGSGGTTGAWKQKAGVVSDWVAHY